MNTLDGDGKVDDVTGKGGKSGEVNHDVQDVDIEHGHLQDIEVDVDKVLHDEGIKGLDADTSPYPEGKRSNQ